MTCASTAHHGATSTTHSTSPPPRQGSLPHMYERNDRQPSHGRTARGRKAKGCRRATHLRGIGDGLKQKHLALARIALQGFEQRRAHLHSARIGAIRTVRTSAHDPLDKQQTVCTAAPHYDMAARANERQQLRPTLAISQHGCTGHPQWLGASTTLYPTELFSDHLARFEDDLTAPAMQWCCAQYPLEQRQAARRVTRPTRLQRVVALQPGALLQHVGTHAAKQRQGSASYPSGCNPLFCVAKQEKVEPSCAVRD